MIGFCKFVDGSKCNAIFCIVIFLKVVKCTWNMLTYGMPCFTIQGVRDNLCVSKMRMPKQNHITKSGFFVTAVKAGDVYVSQI